MEVETWFEGGLYDKPRTGEKIKTGCIKQRNPQGRESIVLSHGKRKWDLIFKHLDEIKAFFNE